MGGSVVPCVVIDTETTGFPSRRGAFRARIVEVGAVVVTADRRVVSPISFYVRQSRSHLESWQARRAMQVHGIRPATLRREGLGAREAAPRLARWIERVQERFGVREVRAYNQSFDFWFLEQSPWDFFDRTGLAPGEDIMETVRRGAAADTAPKLAKAVELANAAGADIPWLGRAHRAGEDARIAAMMALHFTAPGTAESHPIGVSPPASG